MTVAQCKMISKFIISFFLFKQHNNFLIILKYLKLYFDMNVKVNQPLNVKVNNHYKKFLSKTSKTSTKLLKVLIYI